MPFTTRFVTPASILVCVICLTIGLFTPQSQALTSLSQSFALPMTRTQNLVPVIFNGEEDHEIYWQFTVRLEVSGENCSGILIEPSVILTAAHCLKDRDPATAVITFVNPSTGVKHERHPDYWVVDADRRTDAYQVNDDFAVMHLALPEPTGFNPVPIFNAPDDYDFSKDVFVMAGFGATNAAGNERFGETLRYVPQRFEELKSEFGSIVLIPVGNKPTGACFGDSGGPALITRDGRQWLVGFNDSLGYYRECGIETVIAPVTTPVNRVHLRNLLKNLHAQRPPSSAGAHAKFKQGRA